MSEALFLEQIRSALPEIAAPIRPGEKVNVWIDRAAWLTKVPAARLRGYWHRKISVPRISEYIAVMGAAQLAEARRVATAEQMERIESRAAQLLADYEGLRAHHPILARLVPAPPGYQEGGSQEVIAAAGPIGGRP